MSGGRETESGLSRRSLLKAGLTAAGVSTLAGCLPPPSAMSGGTTPGGAIPHNQEITREQADTVVSSASGLQSAVSQSGIVWIDSGSQLDLTGTSLSLENVVVASGRTEGEKGALITTTDRGVDSPVHNDALIELGENARLTGVVVRGPLWNYTESSIIPGYVPFAPGGSWGVREQWRNNLYSRGVSMQADSAQVDNCEIWGWSTGIMVGARERSVSPHILYSAIHNCMLTSAGYPVDVKRGTPTIYRCWFNAYRHALNGFGYKDAGYLAVECTFGPHCSGHVIDMHRVGENARDGGSSDPGDLRYRYRAGGTMLVRNCQIMPTTTVDDTLHNEGSGYINFNPGNTTPHVNIRGAPADGFYFEGNMCAHSDPTTAVTQSSQIPGRFPRNEFGWHNIHVGENQWGVDFG